MADYLHIWLCWVGVEVVLLLVVDKLGDGCVVEVLPALLLKVVVTILAVSFRLHSITGLSGRLQWLPSWPWSA